MKNRRAIINHSRITLGCVALLVATVVLYLYFLNMSVVQVVMRIEYVQEQRDLNTQIATLEAGYIDAQHDIASQVANLDNYITDSEKIFVSREAASLVLGGR